MAGCSDIELGSEVDCDLIPPAGTRPVAILWNRDDVESYEETDGVITDVVLKAGKFAYKFTGLAQAFKSSQDFQRSATTGRGQWKHKGTIVIYERTQEQKNNLKKFGNSRVAGAFFLVGEDDDSIVLAGKEVGIELVAGEIQNAQANDGFFILNLSTPDGDIENESGPMPSIFDTDQETTEAMLNALLAGS